MRDKTKLSERQRGILRFMERYVDEFGFPPTIREIGEATDIKSTSVVNYNLNKLVQGGYLARLNRKSRGIRLTAQSQSNPVRQAVHALKVPYYGLIIAGKPIEIPADAGHHAYETIEVARPMLAGLDESEVFALRVKGDSMIDAMIQEGDIVLLRQQSTANNGEMVAVWLDERSEITLKYFYHEGERIRLQPAHPTMSPIYVNAANCHVQGRVVSVIRTL
ncbi:MAG: transcriptional repressor LexA [Chloroflexota bacterium]|nr:transcriptional repressor LexA [Chloroflexota bacterium]